MRTMLAPVTAAALILGQGAAAAAEFSYAVQFVCGTFAGGDALTPVVPGLYQTAISVANPNDQTVEFSYDVAFTFGSVSFARAEDDLGERDARRLDCDALFGTGNQIGIDAVQVLARRLEGKTAGKLGQ